ncbi:MAG: DinB family protein [Gemmatimonadota bacterium]
MTRRQWFDRRFALGLAPDVLPELIERLRGTPGRLGERMGGLSAKTLVQRPGDAWSIQEQAGHLLDLERLWHARFRELLAGVDVLREADLQNRATWDANHNRRPLSSLLGDFRDARLTWVVELEALHPADLTRTALHPRLRQPMSIPDLCFFVAEHDDHHLAAITALRRDAG